MPTHKDWDEDLKALNGKEAIPASEHTKLEYIKARCLDLRNCTDIYGELSVSKGYLLEQTFGKLHSLLGKIESSSDVKYKQSLLFDMAKTAIAFCYFRDRQLGCDKDIVSYIDKLLSEYKPHKDKMKANDNGPQLKGFYIGYTEMLVKLQPKIDWIPCENETPKTNGVSKFFAITG